MKVDITKAFDSLHWMFLILVLKAFGSNEKFENWIRIIIESSRISISFNGNIKGFFKCERGVKKGDPLSPLIFCIIEEVLSRSISILVDQGKFKYIPVPRGFVIPSHRLYVNDVMIFYRGNKSSIKLYE